MERDDSPDALERYARQIRYAPIGERGQKRLQSSRVLIVGCGALGSVLANTLCRAGVGHLRLVDRDFLELNNLQRQVLYDEEDVRRQLPKAVCAAERLRKVNSRIVIEPVVADVDHENIVGLLEGVDVILDGTDNFETRYLLNDASLKFNIPWVYGGCLGASGQTLTVLPRRTACLRCLHPEPPAPGTGETCDSAGIVGPIINVIASLQALEAMKILVGDEDAVRHGLQICELWENRLRTIRLDSLSPWNGCPCRGVDFPWLSGERRSQSAVLCGRNSVQLSFPERTAVDLAELARRVASVGVVQRNPFLMRLTLPTGQQITIFADGRAIVSGTEDVAEARSLYAQYIGH